MMQYAPPRECPWYDRRVQREYMSGEPESLNQTDREVQLGVRVRGVCIRESLQHEIYRCEG